MPQWYQWAPAIAGLIVSAIAWRVPRAALWVGLLLASFVASSLWWNANLPYPAAFGASTDLAIALIMLKLSRNQWEQYVINCYAFMVLVDGLWQLGQIESHFYYAISLEAANWAILLLIGATGVADRLKGIGLHGRAGNTGSVGLARAHLVAPRHYPRWWRVRE